MKKTKIKLILFLIILCSLLGLFLYLKFKNHSYDITYTVDRFKVSEKYNANKGTYTFLIKNSKDVYPIEIYNKYLNKREIIDNIKLYEEGNNNCIKIKSKYIELVPVCNKEDKIVKYNLSNFDIYKTKKIKKDKIEHEKLNVNYLDDNKYLLYNYKGFYYIAGNKIENIKLTDRDIYQVKLIYQLDEYIIIPDYSKDHYFNKLNIINLKNGNIKEIKDLNISFDSIFLGDYKNKVYLLDKKEEKQYEINIKKNIIKETDFVTLKDNKLHKVSFNKIVKNNLVFDNKEEVDYKIVDNKLYQIIGDYKVLITDKKVDKIIKQIDNTIYYLVSDNLYMYNDLYGEVLNITNHEWNFNNTNMIYLYK